MRDWIKGGIIFVVIATAQGIIDRFLDLSESLLLPAILGASISDIIYVLGIVIGIIFIALGVSKSKEPKLPKEARSVRDFFHTKFLTHLTIHYSRLTDNPDSPNPARPRFVTNNRTNQAFWVSTFIDNNRHAINYHTHNG